MKNYKFPLTIAAMAITCGAFVGCTCIDSKDAFLEKPMKWTSSGVLIEPQSDENHKHVSIKDPTVLRYNGKWHIYATAYSISAILPLSESVPISFR